jgi:predicted AAA+ superfamily ATPase
MIERRILKHILTDLARHKMVFISGPRQSGKTTLTQDLPVPKNSVAYYTWDVEKQRKLIRNAQLDESKEYWILDEVHKYKKWRNLLKGIYDLHKQEHKIIVTGSARLDLYSRGGDSLQGRYFNYRLHPVTLSEYLNQKENDYRKLLIDPKLDYRSFEKICNTTSKE